VILGEPGSRVSLLRAAAGAVAGAWRALPANTTRVALRKDEARPGKTYRLRARFRGNVSEPSTTVTLP
jgi:hypothetical protein